MTKSIKQTKQELDNIRAIAAETAVELQDRYRSYLELLSQSVRQQLILASYQICTEFYPQSFLDLPLSNKQSLQQTLRQIGIDLQPKLMSIIEQQELEPEPNELNLMAELIKNLPKAKIKNKVQEDTETDIEEESVEIDLESIKAGLANIEFIEIQALEESENQDAQRLKSENLEAEKETEPISQTPAKEKIELDNPQHLLLWHKQIERKIKKNLDRISKRANKHLQDAKIIPARIPSKIIDVAMQTEGNKRGKNGQRIPNAPNIIHLAIETELGKKSKNNHSSQISLLRLRLAEIEFNDPMLNVHRNQVRNLIEQIKKLNKQYKITEKQLAVAEAQAAWRSSWYED